MSSAFGSRETMTRPVGRRCLGSTGASRTMLRRRLLSSIPPAPNACGSCRRAPSLSSGHRQEGTGDPVQVARESCPGTASYFLYLMHFFLPLTVLYLTQCFFFACAEGEL